MRTAIYARYSSDNQRDTSIADQFRLADARVQREGWLPPLQFSDSAVSASTPMLLRPGGLALMEAIRAGRVDVLVIESLDRCWRDVVDQERTLREIEFLGVRVIGVSDGYDSNREGRELQRVIMGGVNQQYLRDLGKKVHRGLVGQTARGFHAGGLSYGYRTTVAGLDAKGEPIGHVLEIDEPRAQWVRWCFEQYAGGAAPRKIVYELNHLGVPSPRGSSWAISALYGQPRYGTGILRNELYCGRYVWNRSRWVKHAEKPGRRRIERPREEWHVREVPHLRIVSEDLWRAAQARLSGPKRVTAGKPKRSLLAGILRCGHCGGAVTAVTVNDYGCAAHKDRGPAVCEGVRVKRRTIEAAVLDLVRAELLTDEAIDTLRQEVTKLLRERAREREGATRTAKTRLATVEHEISRLVEAVAAAGWSEALSNRLRQAEAERAHLQADLAEALPNNAGAMIPRLIEHYREQVSRLPAVISAEPATAREALSDLLGSITLTRDHCGAVWAQVASLGGLILNMVAGDRFHINHHNVRWLRVA